MVIFASDIVAGILLVTSLILLLVAVITYKRYGIKAAAISTLVFVLFFIKGVIYVLYVYYALNLDIIAAFMTIDVAILISLYFALAFRG